MFDKSVGIKFYYFFGMFQIFSSSLLLMTSVVLNNIHSYEGNFKKYMRKLLDNQPLGIEEVSISHSINDPSISIGHYTSFQKNDDFSKSL